MCNTWGGRFAICPAAPLSLVGAVWLNACPNKKIHLCKWPIKLAAKQFLNQDCRINQYVFLYYYFFFSFGNLTNSHDSLLKNPLLTLKMRGFRSSCLITSNKVLLTHRFKMTFAFWSKESLWTYAIIRSLMLGCGGPTGCESLVSRFVFAFFTKKKYEQWIGQKVQLKRNKRNSCSVVRQSCGYITSIFHGCSHGISTI